MKYRSRFFLFLGLNAAVSGCMSVLNHDGWVDLMPGPSLEGWTIVDVPADGPPPSRPQWTVDSGSKVLRCTGGGGRDWLRCDKKEYGDFVLHAEWRFIPLPDSAAAYNSGVFVRNAPDWSVWHQAQLGSDNGGYLFGNSPFRGEPKRFNTRGQLKRNLLHPAGEWNSYEIACRGRNMDLSVNGTAATAWDSCEVVKGYVGLEAENYEVEFRNLRIKEF